MTVKPSISVPADAAHLQSHGDASAAVRRVLPEARRARQRAAARAYGEFLRQRPLSEAGIQLIESSNDIALRGSEW